jgi:hypothetical protein
MKPSTITGLSVLGVVVLLGLTWIFQGNDFFLYSVFAPKYESVRRQTFEQTKSYNEGMAQEIRNAELDFARAKTPAEKQAIASYVLHETAGYDTSKLPPDLAAFLSQAQTTVSQ